MPPPDFAALQPLAEQLGAALRARGWRVTAAESCTGGMVCAALTSVAGSSNWFDRGFVTYSNAAKTDMLGVDGALFPRVGAVSAEVAAAMAQGALLRAGADLAVAITGIAGPDGGTPDKPVGTVWFGLARRDGTAPPSQTRRMLFDGERGAVRLQAAAFALRWALEMATSV
ncbi:MAG: CinA family protein [Thiomonas sp.]|jgi:nicotinamide-nucleotide amidase